MNATIFLLLCALLAVTTASVNAGASPNYDSNIYPEDTLASYSRTEPTERIDDYISLNRQQYSKILEYLETRLAQFKENYLARLGGIYLVLDLIADSVLRYEKVLNPLVLLSANIKQCISTYRPALLNGHTAKNSVSLCYVEANNNGTHLPKKALLSKNQLEYYYKNDFEMEIGKCRRNYANYTSCILSVVAKTNEVFNNIQKQFEKELDEAECAAKLNVKAAFDCSYQVQFETLSLISESNVNINRCINGDDQCPACQSCEQFTEIAADQLRNKELLMNPFYLHEDSSTCLLLKAIDNKSY